MDYNYFILNSYGDIMPFLQFLKDEYVFPLLQIFIVIVALVAVFHDTGWFRPKSSVSLSVKRGDQSWNYFQLANGASLAVMFAIIEVTETIEGYKTFITIFNVLIFTYLAFFSGWYRNQIVGFINKSKNMEEN